MAANIFIFHLLGDVPSPILIGKDNLVIDGRIRVDAATLLTDLRAREFYEKPTAERKRKKAAAVKRHYKRVRSMQLPKKLY